MDISDEDKALIADHLARGEPLPDRFRFSLFREPREAELIWPGKTHEVTSAILPFQSIEQIDEPRVEAHVTHDLFSRDAISGRQAGGWSNKLIWGDNKLVLSSLRGGPLRKQIEDAGGLKLVYIDPPFDVGADFSFRIQVGDESLTKEPSVIEDVAYRDTWGRGKDSYVAMLSERFHSIHDLLAPDGSVFVHVDERMSPFVRLLLEERFGSENYINTITWKRSDAHSDAGQGAKHFGRVTDHILYYSRTPDAQILNMQYSPLSTKTADKWYRHVEEGTGRRYNKADITGPGGAVKGNPVYEWNGVTRAWRFSRARMEELHNSGRVVYSSSGQAYLKRYLDESKGIPIQDLWDDIGMIRGIHTNSEAVGYATQKPEALLERVISLGSNPGDLVADFFCGSGTTLAVAEKLGRKWIGADLGRFAIHTSRKRLIGVQRQLKTEAKPYRSFEILNLGKYERQYFVGIDPTLPEAQRRAISAEKEARYVDLILTAYSAQAVEQTPPFHGRKQGAFVLVGPVDAPVVEGQITEAVDAARRLGAARVDVLGFEFEMGLSPRVSDEARAKGVQLALRYIPKDVFDRRAVEKGQVSFHDLAYVEAKATVVSKRDRSVTVSLTDFGVSYRQEDVEALTAGMKAGSKVTVDQGQVVKVTKAKSGEVTREVLTKAWTDWIDYWAVDFDYASRPETIVVTEADGSGRMIDRPQWTGGYIFENEWQAFRTRRDRTLELTSARHEYSRPGRYRIAVKVIDIFGNDTTKVIGVEV
jgi:adenine-specific DNA-methyltransferase